MAASLSRRIRVLFIDDDGSIRIFAGAMFNDQLFDVKVASNTKEADSLLRSMTFDIIVCDVMMPEEDGIQFCNRLKKSGNTIPFLFLSALSAPDTVATGLAAGANAYFIKPFDARDLQQRIISLVVKPGKTPPDSMTRKPPKKAGWFGRS